MRAVPDESSPDFVLTLPKDARACGNCRLWRPHSRNDQRVWVGNCRVMPGRGLFPPEAPPCSSFLPRDAALPSAMPAARTRVEAARPVGSVAPVVVRHSHPVPDAAPVAPRPSVPDVELGEDFSMTREELKAIIREALGEQAVALAPKWEGGTVVLKPRDPAAQSKELPLDALFHKVVMIRDRLRTLEQKINAHPKLTDTEKVDFQQYITKSYGSLTSFNVLFHEKRDQFVGDKSE